MFESNMAQAIVFFFLLIVFYYINKSIAESADEELKKETDQKQARDCYKSK
jgi:Na+-transporting methylmalonyl-CoA/oxaloacetate decarboxylase gamma subunit